MKTFLSGLLLIVICVLGYFWMEGIGKYNATRPVEFTIKSHVLLAWNSDQTALVLDKNGVGVVHVVSLLDYQTYSDGQGYPLPVYIEPRSTWKGVMFEVIPAIIGIVGGVFLLLMFLAIVAG